MRSLFRGRIASVRVRITLVATVAVGLALAIGGVGLLLLLRHDLLRSLNGDAHVRAAEVAGLAERGALPKPFPLLGTPDLTLVQVLDARGQVTTASAELTGVGPLSTPGSHPMKRLASPPFGHGQDYAAVAVAVQLRGQPATVVVVSSLADFYRSLTLLGGFLLVGLPLIVLMVAGGTWIAVGRSLRPVDDMRAQVDGVTTGALDRRVAEPPSNDEISRLAKTLNTMLDRLQAASLRQQRFVADASHELRSPIANIRTELEVALYRPQPTNWPEVARGVLAEDTRMSDLVDELLLLARFDEGGLDTSSRRVDLAELVSVVCSERDVASGGRGPALEATDLITAYVEANPGHLERVVSNLVDNAMRYAASQVTVTVHPDAAMATLVVVDDGPGIPDDQQARIFERFVRLDEARDRASGGFGLGLAIAKDLVGVYGGTIVVSDAAPGAHFAVRLPLSSPVSLPAERGRRPESVVGSSSEHSS